jgi:hypothetical protein
MAADNIDTRDADRSIEQTLTCLYQTIQEQATAEDDARRVGILQAMGKLLEQPLRAASLLTEHDTGRTRHH